jgi:hypothetical protein
MLVMEAMDDADSKVYKVRVRVRAKASQMVQAFADQTTVLPSATTCLSLKQFSFNS